MEKTNCNFLLFVNNRACEVTDIPPIYLFPFEKYKLCNQLKDSCIWFSCSLLKPKFSLWFTDIIYKHIVSLNRDWCQANLNLAWIFIMYYSLLWKFSPGRYPSFFNDLTGMSSFSKRRSYSRFQGYREWYERQVRFLPFRAIA